MVNYVSKFEKVSFEQFKKDIGIKSGTVYTESLEDLWDKIILPRRKTFNSAGYDFFFPLSDMTLAHNSTIVIPTGIKVKIRTSWFMGMFPKSKFGYNYRIKLDDTIPVIDGDFYNCEDCEGHIMIKMTNMDSQRRPFRIHNGDAYCQGIFMQYGRTINDPDDDKVIRCGGIGSTS